MEVVEGFACGPFGSSRNWDDGLAVLTPSLVAWLREVAGNGEAETMVLQCGNPSNAIPSRTVPRE
jgi:hypothetical protein